MPLSSKRFRRSALRLVLLMGAGLVGCDQAQLATSQEEAPPAAFDTLQQAACAAYATFGAQTKVRDVQHASMTEASGLAASRKNAGVYYTHNEDTKTLFAMNTTSGVFKTFKYDLPTPTAYKYLDWEDVQAGPCTGSTNPTTTNCIWAGDIGKSAGSSFNSSEKTTFNFFRATEPDTATAAEGSTLTVTKFPFKYENGGYDAETFLLHPTTGNLYVITKSQTGASRVYRYPMPLDSAQTKQLTYIRTLNLPTSSTDVWFQTTTAGAVHPCAPRFLLRTYRKIYEFRSSDTNFENAFFDSQRVTIGSSTEGQGEAVAYSQDGTTILTVTELATNAARALNKYVKQ